MTDKKMPSDQTAALAKSLAKGSTDPKHGLTVPQKIIASTKKS